MPKDAGSPNHHPARADALQACAYPRTPHIPGGPVSDEDRTMAQDELSALCRTCQVVLQEKVDGTNVGIFF